MDNKENAVVVSENTVTTTELRLKTYTASERNYYLFGMLGQNIIYNVIGAALAYYLQFTLLIPAMAVSTIMTVARVWDAFNDPMMGTLVDRTRSKWGKCRPFLMFVPLPIFVITVLCFVNFGFYSAANSPGLNALIIGWAAAMYILWGMTYTIGDIPLWGITALMTEDEKDRNKLLSLARVFGGVGAGITLLAIQPVALAVGDMLAQKFGANLAGSESAWQAIVAEADTMSKIFAEKLAAGVPYEQLTEFTKVNEILAEATRQGERWGFLIAAVLFAAVGCCLFQLAGLKTKERVVSSEKKYNLKENFTIMWKNKPFRQILVSGILGSPKMLLMIAAMPLITYYYASKSPILALLYMLLLGGGMFGGQFVAMALAPKLLTKFSKKKLYNYGNLIGVVPFLLIFVCYLISPQTLNAWYYVMIFFILFLFAGASMGLTTVLQSLMIADCVDYEEYKNGVRPDGVFFSGQTFIAKLTSGIATILGGIAYSVVGFTDSEIAKVNDYISAGLIPREIPDFNPYMMILFFIVSVPPAIGCILSVIPTWNYCLDDDRHNKILAALNARRHGIELEDNDSCDL